MWINDLVILCPKSKTKSIKKLKKLHDLKPYLYKTLAIIWGSIMSLTEKPKQWTQTICLLLRQLAKEQHVPEKKKSEIYTHKLPKGCAGNTHIPQCIMNNVMRTGLNWSEAASPTGWRVKLVQTGEPDCFWLVWYRAGLFLYGTGRFGTELAFFHWIGWFSTELARFIECYQGPFACNFFF